MNIVYKITFKTREANNTKPFMYIGSKSNCTFENGRIITARGKEYFGSSRFKGYNDIVQNESDILIEILHECDVYADALKLELSQHIANDVVLDSRYFNQQFATESSFADPDYKTMRHIETGKICRLRESEITSDWEGTSKGRCWYNNGTINKLFLVAPEGWTKGRIAIKSSAQNFYKNSSKDVVVKKGVASRMANGSYNAANKGKIAITNGTDNTYISAELPIPDGWRRGMCRKPKS